MSKLFLALIVCFGLFLSFYRVSELYGYGFDQERDYLAVKAIVADHKFTLIGPRVVSSAGFFLGPFYYYLQVPFFILFRGDPLYGAYFTAAINFLTYLLIYFVLSRLTPSRLTAFTAALLWLTTANRTGWNVSFVPLFFLLFVYFHKRPLLLTFIFFLSLNFHPQMIFLGPLWLHALTKHKLSLRQIILLVFAPILHFPGTSFFRVSPQPFSHGITAFDLGNLCLQGTPLFLFLASTRPLDLGACLLPPKDRAGVF